MVDYEALDSRAINQSYMCAPRRRRFADYHTSWGTMASLRRNLGNCLLLYNGLLDGGSQVLMSTLLRTTDSI